MSELRTLVEAAWENRDLLSESRYAEAVHETMELLDTGRIRVAEPLGAPGEWRVNAWIKQAILLFFGLSKVQVYEFGDFRFRDLIPPKTRLEEAGIRVVPPGVARYGSFLEAGAILMPGYVNIGAYVGAGTMVDTWATVGSCAQIGSGVHLSGGVGIGGVLEPPSASPVIIEDGCFIGSRCVVVEGTIVEREAVLGAGVVLTSSTPIIDVTGDTPKTVKGRVPARSVVIPGVRPKQFAAGEYNLPCALIVGKRSESTDRKTSLNEALRSFAVQA
ncbi:MAG TPA: 2,3,4,5-tetrahydropyridine-2,6-dicarboxylate N-succinyltransferase [Myxococcales bacterium]|nr:2,3,4,5-tetrahydropyridine-2,6-dicarboxylate N-succinyltransferase [Myxococcales bacterium]HIN86755.1 2,3,4,5-tetrahydropyridine-2,6-dicarboxylate N-succinyltransferase [Myxococcales bacterium]